MRGFMTNAMMCSASASCAGAASARANRSSNIIAIISDVRLLASVFVVLAGIIISLGSLLPVIVLVVVSILSVILLVLAGEPMAHRERRPIS